MPKFFVAIGMLLPVLLGAVRALAFPLAAKLGPDAPEQATIYVHSASVLEVHDGVNVLEVQLTNVGRGVFDGDLRLDLPPGLRSTIDLPLSFRIHPGRQRFLFLRLMPEQYAKLNGAQLAVRLVDRSGSEAGSRKVALQLPHPPKGEATGETVPDALDGDPPLLSGDGGKGILYIQTASELALHDSVNLLEVWLTNVGRGIFDGDLRLDLPPGLRSAIDTPIPLRVSAGGRHQLFLRLMPERYAKLNGAQLAVRLVDRSGSEAGSRKVALRVAKNDMPPSPDFPKGKPTGEILPDSKQGAITSPLGDEGKEMESRREAGTDVHPHREVPKGKPTGEILPDSKQGTITSPLGDEGKEEAVIDLQADSVIVLQVGLNGLDVRLANLGGEAFAGELRLDLPPELRSINGASMALHIPAGKKRFLSLKLTGGQMSKLRNAHLYLRVADGGGREVARHRVLLQVPAKRSVLLRDQSDPQYLRREGDSVRIKILLANNGTTDERLRLLFSSPDRANDRSFREVVLTLPSGSDSIVRVSFPAEKYMLALPRYTVRASGQYADGDVFGRVETPFSNMASERDYRRMFRSVGSVAAYSGNYIDLEVDDALGENRTFTLGSQGEYGLWGGRLRYSAMVGGRGDMRRPPTLGSMYMEYERNNLRVELGNVQESLEASFYGRGLKVALRDTARARVLSGGIVEKNSSLFGFPTGRVLGFSAFTRLVQGGGDPARRHYDSQLYFDRNRQDSTESLLWSSTFDLTPPGTLRPGMYLGGSAGAGLQTFRPKGAQRSQTKPSAAFGLKWSGKAGPWDYSGDGFFSTAYYTGNRRGVFQFGQRIGRRAGKVSYGMGYAYSRYAPRYFRSGLASAGSSYSQLDLSVQMPLSPLAGISLNPSYNLEKGGYRQHGDATDMAARSWMLSASGNLRSPDYRHALYAQLETGWVSVSRRLAAGLVFRGSASYSYKGMGISAAYQKGAFQVFEILNSHLSGAPFGDRTSIGMSYDGSLLAHKLTWRANVLASSTSGYGIGYTAHANATYRLWTNTTLTGTVQYSYDLETTAPGRARTNLCLGLRQNLAAQRMPRTATRAGNLKVFCFHDNNSNDRFDEGDEIATDYGFMVRDVRFVTDGKGTAYYKRMPYGSYALFFPMQDGYRGVSRAVEMDGREVELAVPLQKAGTVRGAVAIHHDPAFSLKADLRLDGYRIIATDENGQTFETYSKEDGGFECSLPPGSYSFAMAEEAFPENIFISENAQQADVSAGRTVELKSFALQVRRKKVEVKRFGK